MLKADELKWTCIRIDGKYVAMKPEVQTLKGRLKDAIQVLKGKVVTFYKQ